MNRLRIAVSAALACFLAVPGPSVCFSQREGAGDDKPVESITRPSADVTLSFVRPGKIAKVFVKEGQNVEAPKVEKPPGGENEGILVKQDDSAELLQLAQLEAQFMKLDEVRVKAAVAQLDQKRVDLKKIEQAAEKGAATTLELEHARLEVKIAELSVDLAKFQQVQDEQRHKEMIEQIKRMRMASPIAGRVERILVEEGESVDSLDPVIRIVQINPLWIDAYVPLKQARARGLKAGDPAGIAFSKEGRVEAAGSILHMGSVADPASETILVRVELPNAEGRTAGERVWIHLGYKQAAEAEQNREITGIEHADKKE